jgi:hypothetical protein
MLSLPRFKVKRRFPPTNRRALVFDVKKMDFGSTGHE